jgi:4-amino-4-deoxy-L-arabinose transferase-like glycosyltransferase
VLFFLFLLACIVLICIGLNYLLKKFKPDPVFFLSAVIIIAILLRLFWILNVNTALFSDFKGYFDYGAQIAKGSPHFPNNLYALFPFTVGYPIVLAGLFKIFGISLFAVKLLNIFCSVILLILIYLITNKIFNRKAAYFASFIFAVWPTQIMYTSVPATEHIFIVFFMLSIYLTFLIPKSEGKNKIILSVILGISIMLAQFIRPVALMLIPSIFIYIFLLQTKKKFITALLNKTVICMIILAGYLLCYSALYFSTYSFTGVDISKTSAGYSLLMGTNLTHGGAWNADDAKIIDEFNGVPEIVQKEAMKRGIDRIKKDPVKFIAGALFIKEAFLWSDEGYGYYWSTQTLASKSGFVKYMETNSKSTHSLYQIVYIFILMTALFGSLAAFRKKIFETIPMLLYSISLFVSFLFLEVQGRYAFPVMPLMIVLSGFGITQIFDKIHLPAKIKGLLKRTET